MADGITSASSTAINKKALDIVYMLRLLLKDIGRYYWQINCRSEDRTSPRVPSKRRQGSAPTSRQVRSHAAKSLNSAFISPHSDSHQNARQDQCPSLGNRRHGRFWRGMQEVRLSAGPDLSSVLPLLLKDLDGSQSTPQDIATLLRRRERVTSRARAALEKSHTVPLSLEGSPETVPPLPVRNPRRRPRVP
jgi:hypothetical protein